MACTKIEEMMIEKALADHSPITVAGLTFTHIGESDGDIRIDLPTNRDLEATVMDAQGAEALCCWLTLAFPLVQKYIERLRRKAGEYPDGQTLGHAMQASIRKIRGDASRPGPHSGDAAWLAEKTGLALMTTLRYLQDKAIPQNHIALPIARILGWSDAEMRKRVEDQRVNQAVKKAEGREEAL